MRLDPLAALAAPLLAESTLPDPGNYASLGWGLAIIFGLVGMANQGMELWKKLHPEKSPPDHDTYATKHELASVQQALATAKQDMTGMERRVEDAIERLEEADETRGDLIERWRLVQDEWMRQVERAIGRIEAKVDQD